jgi:hypothetical protein
MATQTTQRPGAHDVEAARQAGVDAAQLVLSTQIAAGMNPDEIDAAVERVLGDRFNEPTPASDGSTPPMTKPRRTWSRKCATQPPRLTGPRRADRWLWATRCSGRRCATASPTR